MPLYNYSCEACGKTYEEFMPSSVENIRCQTEGCTGLAQKTTSSNFSIPGMTDKSGNKMDSGKYYSVPKLLGGITIASEILIGPFKKPRD